MQPLQGTCQGSLAKGSAQQIVIQAQIAAQVSHNAVLSAVVDPIVPELIIPRGSLRAILLCFRRVILFSCNMAESVVQWDIICETYRWKLLCPIPRDAIQKERNI